VTTTRRQQGDDLGEAATAGDLPDLVGEWVRGWTVSRSTPAPVAVPGGWRVDVGLPGHRRRYVLHGYDPSAVQRLIRRDNPPGTWIKVATDPARMHGDLPDGWTPSDTGHLMTTTYGSTDAIVGPPSPYTISDEISGRVVTVVVVDPAGQVAASARLAVAGTVGVVDQVETAPEHRRRGLGSAVMRHLAGRAVHCGVRTGILVATDDGRHLYRTLGWTTATPIAVAYLPEPDNV
jgi:GNAT superfamily N-acetyltransferase